MLSTLFPIVTFSRLAQPENALSPIVSTISGRVISTRLAHDKELVAFTFGSGQNKYTSAIYYGQQTAQTLYDTNYQILKANLYK